MAGLNEIFPLDDLKDHLRISTDETDNRLRLDLQAAVVYVEKVLARNLLDQTLKIEVEFPHARGLALSFQVSDLKTVSEVGYWLADDPELQVIAAADLQSPRLIQSRQMAYTFPAEAWPEAALRRPGRVTVEVGVDPADVLDSWKKAIVLFTGDFYDGNNAEELPSKTAAMRLLKISAPPAPFGIKQTFAQMRGEARRGAGR